MSEVVLTGGRIKAQWCDLGGTVPLPTPYYTFFSGVPITLVSTVDRYVLVTMGSYKTLSPHTLLRRKKYGGRKGRRALERLREYDHVWHKINCHFENAFHILITNDSLGH